MSKLSRKWLQKYRINTVCAKQKHLGCKKVRGQLEVVLQTGVTKNFDIKKLLIKNLFTT